MGGSRDGRSDTRSSSPWSRPLLDGKCAALRALLTGLLLFASVLGAEGGPVSAPLPGYAAAPLLFVRVGGPPGTRVTFYPGASAGREFAVPVVVGLRPGYIYRLKLTGLTNYPAAAVYPTLEVRGTLRLPPQFNAAQFPAPVLFSAEDLAKALTGALLTKVVYLEHPERAVPTATRPEQPLEVEVPPHGDPLAEARQLGRPVLILRAGGREVSPDELAGQAIPGTILFPGETMLAHPPVGPCLPWASLAVVDPIAGPRPLEEECLHDGGDAGQPAGLDREGRLHGLDPADTVAEFTDDLSRRRIAISNRVCLCAPRYSVLRAQITPTAYNTAVTLGGAQTVLAQSQLRTRQPSLETEQIVYLEAVRGRERSSATESTQALVAVEQFEGTARIIGRIQEQTVVGTPAKKPCPPVARPLELCKWADKQVGQVGDVVTFYLKYTNPGGEPITDVVVSDSLTGRLEFVPGSDRSDRTASFAMQQNEAGSAILRWEVAGRLLPGQSGMLSFQVRIR
jgi:uncharacterized repeat protein (TIGR01451 family)